MLHMLQFDTLHSHYTLHSLHSTLALYYTHYALQLYNSTLSTRHTLQLYTHIILYTLHSTHYTLHTTHYTLHTTHYTLHTTHYTLHTTHYTPYTLHTTTLQLYNSTTLQLYNSTTLQLYNSTPYTIHPLYTPHTQHFSHTIHTRWSEVEYSGLTCFGNGLVQSQPKLFWMSPDYISVRHELATAMEIETSGERLAEPLHQTCVVVQTFHDGEDVGWMVVIAVHLPGQRKEVINLVPAQPLDELK